jgi:hypothetical protein
VTTVVHVASSQKSRGVQVEDGRVDVTGCVGLFYPNFTILMY